MKMATKDMPKMPKTAMQKPKNQDKCKDVMKDMPKGGGSWAEKVNGTQVG